MSRNQENLGSTTSEKGKFTLKLASAMLAAAALSGCTTSEAPEPRPVSSTEYVTPSLEEELGQKLEQNRLKAEDLEIVVAEYGDLEGAANAWWDTFVTNCVEHGNPRLSYENNLQFVASAADLQAKVYDELKIGENLEVCKESLMNDVPEAEAWVSGSLKNLNTIFVANQMLGAEPNFERLPLQIESVSESEISGTVPTVFSVKKPDGIETAEESLGFRFTVSDRGTLVWNKRG